MAAEPSQIALNAKLCNSFVANWAGDKYFYSQAASLAAELCEGLLSSSGIRAIVTHRVKQKKRLETKLEVRMKSPATVYNDSEDIRNDIVDLAGVRIALYFPSDSDKIAKIINDTFTVIRHIRFPSSKKQASNLGMSAKTGGDCDDFQRRFDGYRADHFRVRMRAENLETQQLRDDFSSLNPLIEIQVASVLMHAWAEVDHDLVYKTLTSGSASRQELRLLDAINGLAHTGEILLQELQTATNTRVSYQSTPFLDQYQLRSFLQAQPKLANDPLESMDHLDALFKILESLELISPLKLAPYLDSWAHIPCPEHPLALSLLDHILGPLSNTEAGKAILDLRSQMRELENSQQRQAIPNPGIRNLILSALKVINPAVEITNLLRFPKKSILILAPEFHEFIIHYNTIDHLLAPRVHTYPGHLDFLTADAVALVQLWKWFEENGDTIFRVSLKIAARSMPGMVDKLKELHPSRSFHIKANDKGEGEPEPLEDKFLALKPREDNSGLILEFPRGISKKKKKTNKRSEPGMIPRRPERDN
jgi:ppGpp synthetase/RelA/SpoT-type nucleotidyltranferase